jgi:hypothetical protein
LILAITPLLALLLLLLAIDAIIADITHAWLLIAAYCCH